MSTITKIQEVVFSMDDIDNEVYFEDFEETIFDGLSMERLMGLVVKTDWFIQGNKTEGVIEITPRTDKGFPITLTWNEINMEIDEDGNISDDTTDHEKSFFFVDNGLDSELVY